MACSYTGAEPAGFLNFGGQIVKKKKKKKKKKLNRAKIIKK